MKLTVIIVSYNVKFYVEQCLNSLEKALEGIDSEIFIVDNHSRDGSANAIMISILLTAATIWDSHVQTTLPIVSLQESMYFC